MARTIGELLEHIKGLQERDGRGENVASELAQVREELEVAKTAEALRQTRGGSRYAGQHSAQEVADRLAAGGVIMPGQNGLVPGVAQLGGPQVAGGEGAKFFRDVVSAKAGNPDAQRRLMASKAWEETTGGAGGAGGFLVADQVLPNYVPVRAAAAPIRELASFFAVQSDQVVVNIEGNQIEVEHLGELVTKPDSTGSIAQKVSTVHKVAGTSTVSDELLADTNGTVATLIGGQFGRAIGQAQDIALLSGSGVGEPLGVLNTPGVNAVAVDGQTGRLLYASIRKAIGRLREKFYAETELTVLLHPRDATKFDIAEDAEQRLLFSGGLGQALGPVRVVVDANIPANTGAGLNESRILVGAFRELYFFSRQPLTVESSRDAAWFEDATVFRGVERYGAALVKSEAVEVLTGITP